MNRKNPGKLLFLSAGLLLVLLIVYSGLRILESTVLLREQRIEDRPRKTITRQGVDYFPRQDITTVLLLGINQEGQVHAEEFNHGNAADLVAVLVFDEAAGEAALVNLNRDAMVTMPTLREDGRENGTFYGQLAFAHTYGTGLEDSCENVRRTVSGLLYGTNIDYYISLNIDAVPVLNDAVGGVTVNVTDDFSGVDSTIPRGRVTLTGEQARTFVQTRWGVSEDLNLGRIERQKEYMKRFAEKFRSLTDADGEFILNTYNQAAPYIVSDLPVSTLSAMIQRYRDYPLSILSLEGENILGQTYYEFYPDEEKLEALILSLFYAPK